MPKYRVLIVDTYTKTQEVEVEAADKAEAEREAVELYSATYDDEPTFKFRDGEAEAIEVEELDD